MTFKKIPSHMLLIILCAACFLSYIFTHKKSAWDHWSPLLSRYNPTFGSDNSPHHLLVFFEPRCAMCLYFQEHVFPRLQETRIHQGLIKVTLIPIATNRSSYPQGELVLSLAHHHLENMINAELLQFAPSSLKELLETKIGAESTSFIVGSLENNMWKRLLEANRMAFEKFSIEETYTPLLILDGKILEDADLSTIESRLL